MWGRGYVGNLCTFLNFVVNLKSLLKWGLYKKVLQENVLQNGKPSFLCHFYSRGIYQFLSCASQEASQLDSGLKWGDWEIKQPQRSKEKRREFRNCQKGGFLKKGFCLRSQNSSTLPAKANKNNIELRMIEPSIKLTPWKTGWSDIFLLNLADWRYISRSR